MALTLTLDYGLPIVDEPGFHREVTTRRLTERGNPSNQASHQGLWCDEPTRTLMLRPLQLESSWLNTPAQVDSLISLADMVAEASNLSTGRIFEAPAFGNNDNPWVFHRSVGPSSAFPAATAPGAIPGDVPGDGPSLVELPTPIGPTLSSVTTTQGPTVVYNPSLTSISSGDGSAPLTVPPVTPIGTETSGKFLTQTKTRLAANQALFFRWFQPASLLGFPCIYEFYVGQYKIRVKDVVAEIFLDTSHAGDRTSFQKVQTCPLWSVGDTSPTGAGLLTAIVRPSAYLDHDRSLLWLPFRRNQVLLYSNEGKWALLQVNPEPVRLTDDSDWNITRSDTLLVWVITPAAGRFQVQKVKYPSGTIKIQAEPITLDYTPGGSPTVALIDDTDHGSTLTAAITQPPAYTIPVNQTDDCPAETTTSTDQRREYGVELSLTASSDKRWTPFFYQFSLHRDRSFTTYGATPTTVSDTHADKVIVSAHLQSGLDPGEGRLTLELLDANTFPLAPYYYRSSIPLQLKDGASVLFTGLSQDPEMTPLIETGAPRRLTIPALDRWNQLSWGLLRDTRDWTPSVHDGVYWGHIDVVRQICELGGVDCSAAEFPASYTPHTRSTINSSLGLEGGTVAQIAGDLKRGWSPRDDDTPASFLKRIRDFYSGWTMGFRLDGTFFYLPRDYFTSSSVTFASSHAGSTPRFYDPVTFTTKEPEANFIIVIAADDRTGTVRHSSAWIDFASILNPNAVNYLGREKREAPIIGGTYSCRQLNRMARIIWEQTRRRRIEATFEADFVPSLGIGHVFTLGSYGNYRLTHIDVTLDETNFHRAHYTGELIEKGYGLP
jgi:hypothetical protein